MMTPTFCRTATLVVCALATSVSAPVVLAQQAATPPPRTASPCPGCGFAPEPLDPADTAGWTQIFDGKTLEGWDGNPAVWKVENGTITAESTAERRVGSTYIIWRGGEPSDFELKLEIKADTDIHSGVFYRGTVGPNPQRAGAPARGAGSPAANRPQQPAFAVPADVKWNVTGYSLDFDYGRDNDGNVQDTSGRTEPQIGWRGHIIRMEAGKRPRSIGSLGDRELLAEKIKPGEWNQLHIIARGNQLTHIVNGQVMAILIDDDPVYRKTKGVIALQIEQYGTGRINFRNVWLKQ
jgi:3-keto-disaccharide hydrolase